MPTLIEALKKRRSIRKYHNRPVSNQIIRELLDAAKWAPSAHNSQPWRFIVLQDKSAKRKFAEAMAEDWRADMIKDGVPEEIREMHAKSSVDRFTNAPTLIVVCVTMRDMVNRTSDLERKNERDMAVQSVGAAVQNILLAAESKNLGSCWFCAPLFCKNSVRRTLEIPEDVEPHALLALGYPAEKPHPPPRNPVESYSFLHKWNQKLE